MVYNHKDSESYLLNEIFKDNKDNKITAADMRKFVGAIYSEKVGVNKVVNNLHTFHEDAVLAAPQGAVLKKEINTIGNELSGVVQDTKLTMDKVNDYQLQLDYMKDIAKSNEIDVNELKEDVRLVKRNIDDLYLLVADANKNAESALHRINELVDLLKQKNVI